MKIKKPIEGLTLGFEPVTHGKQIKLDTGFVFNPKPHTHIYDYISIKTELGFLSDPVEAASDALERLYQLGLIHSYCYSLYDHDPPCIVIHIVYKLTIDYDVLRDIKAIKRRYLNEAILNTNPKTV